MIKPPLPDQAMKLAILALEAEEEAFRQWQHWDEIAKKYSEKHLELRIAAEDAQIILTDCLRRKAGMESDHNYIRMLKRNESQEEKVSA